MSLMIVLLLITFLEIGYAAIVSNLEIKGYSQIKSSSFDVHFENMIIKSGSVEAITNATIESTNRTRIDYSVIFEKPGDFYEFTVDVVNDGSLDAMVETVTSKMNNTIIDNNLPNYLEYNVTYEDGIAIANNHMLNAGKIETYKVRVAYSTNINPDDLPTTASTLNFSFGVNYIQKDSNAINRPTLFVYTTSGSSQKIGTTFNTTSSPDPETAMSNFGHNAFIRHKVEDSVITESYVGFKSGGKIYYLRGGVDEGKFDPRPKYTDNKNELDKSFGSENCIEMNYISFSYYQCSNDSLSAYAYSYGIVNVWDDSFYCYIYNNNISHCHVN